MAEPLASFYRCARFCLRLSRLSMLLSEPERLVELAHLVELVPRQGEEAQGG